MLLKSLANTYAEGFMKNLEAKQYAEAYEDISTFVELYAQEPRIKLLLGNPAIPEEEKFRLVASIAERGRFIAISRNFLALVLKNGRMELLSDIAESIEELTREYEGRVIANITSAVDLTGEQVERLRNKLSMLLGKTVEINVAVDRSLIGGMVIRVGDKIIDSSVANTLNNVKESLIKGW